MINKVVPDAQAALAGIADVCRQRMMRRLDGDAGGGSTIRAAPRDGAVLAGLAVWLVLLVLIAVVGTPIMLAWMKLRRGRGDRQSSDAEPHRQFKNSESKATPRTEWSQAAGHT